MNQQVNISVMIDSDKKSIELGIEESYKEIGLLITEYAKNHHRYKNRSGKLTDSIAYNLGKQVVNCYIDDSKAPYGKFIYFGFKSWLPDKFIEEAINNNLQNITDIITKNIDRSLGI